MLEQLDLFSAVAQEKPTDYKQLLKERKLTPPAIIEITEPSVAPDEEKLLTPVIEQISDNTVEKTIETKIPDSGIITDTEPSKKTTRGRKSQKK